MLALSSVDSVCHPRIRLGLKIILGLTKTILADIQRRKPVVMVNLLLKVWFIL